MDEAIVALRESATRDLSRNQLPLIRNTAVASGGLGGSRQGIAEGLAFSDLNRDLINTEASLRSGQFNTDTSNKLLALINQGSILGGQGAGTETLLKAGGIVQDQDQAEIGGVIDKFTEEQNLGFNRDQELLRILTGAPTATTQPVPQANPIVTGLGAALTAGQLFPGQPQAPAPILPAPLPPGISPTAGGGTPLLSPF